MRVRASSTLSFRSAFCSSLALRGAAVAAVVALFAPASLAQVSTLNLNFNGAGGGFANTGFEAAYNPDASGYNLNVGGNGRLGLLTLDGDIYGGYENDPDSGKNMFYSSMTTGPRTVIDARVTALNINSNYHGGGIWMGTDQDHYIRLGIINNSNVNPNGPVSIEALRENEDRWPQDGLYPARPGADIESQYLGVTDATTATVGGSPTGRDLNAILRLVRDGTAVACYVSTNNGVSFSRLGGDTYSFNSLAIDATTLRIDNRTEANPNNPDLTSSTVEGGFKVGVYAFGGGGSKAVLQYDSLTAVSGTPTYTGPASGDWTTDANWNNNNGIGAPTNIESSAVLPSTTSARTLNVPSNIVLTNLEFDSAAGTTINGTGQITFDWFYYPTHPTYYNTGPGKVSVSAGSHTIAAPTVLSHLHQFDIAGGSSLTLSNLLASTFNPENPASNADAGIRKLGAGTLNVSRLQTNQIDVQAGTLKISSGAAVSTVKSIAVTTGSGSTAKLDLSNNKLVVNYDDTNTPIAAIEALLKSGYGTGANWGGPGIISSDAAASPSRGIGFAEASALAVVPAAFGTVDANAVLLAYTFKGDSDLNGTVDFDDLLKLAQNYNTNGKSWVDGDANYDNEVNFDDLLALAQNYGTPASLDDSVLAGFGAGFQADWALAQSLVPEPTTIVLAAAPLLAVRRRRVK